jgi:ribosomal protein S18 acetylase RimI-like enzyme
MARSQPAAPRTQRQPARQTAPTSPHLALRFRHALPADLSALLALEEASFSGDKLSASRVRHWISADNAILLLAVTKAALLGSCLLIRRADSSAARLYSIAIASAARGRGLGAKLLKKAEALARAEGSESVRLEVAAGNAAAIALYHKLGYREFGRKLAYYEDGQDALRMQKVL